MYLTEIEALIQMYKTDIIRFEADNFSDPESETILFAKKRLSFWENMKERIKEPAVPYWDRAVKDVELNPREAPF